MPFVGMSAWIAGRNDAVRAGTAPPAGQPAAICVDWPGESDQVVQHAGEHSCALVPDHLVQAETGQTADQVVFADAGLRAAGYPLAGARQPHGRGRVDRGVELREGSSVAGIRGAVEQQGHGRGTSEQPDPPGPGFDGAHGDHGTDRLMRVQPADGAAPGVFDLDKRRPERAIAEPVRAGPC